MEDWKWKMQLCHTDVSIIIIGQPDVMWYVCMPQPDLYLYSAVACGHKSL